MTTITKEIKVYRYAELSDEAKAKIKQWYLDGQESDIFTDNCLEELNTLFPNSNLKVEYQFCYCQGDGFNIFGYISLYDLYNNIKTDLTSKEQKFFKWLFEEFDSQYSTYRIMSNYGFPYHNCDKCEYTEEIEWELENNWIRGINYNALDNFNHLSKSFMSKLLEQYKQEGYEYFYEISEEDLQAYCDYNDYTFLANGEIYSCDNDDYIFVID